MNNFLIRHRPTIGIALFALGTILSAVACGVLVLHTRLFSLKRDTAAMIGATLPELQSSVALLEANVQAEQIFTENGLLSAEEIAEMYVLPSPSAGPRLVRATSGIASALSLDSGQKIAVEHVSLEGTPTEAGTVRSQQGRMILRGNFQLVSRFLAILGLAGDLTVGDALSDDVRAQFLTALESAAPLSLEDAETFLWSDLLLYLSDPDAREARLWRDIPVGLQPDLKTLLLKGGLAEARAGLGSIAASLKRSDAWPPPLTRIDSVKRSVDRWTVDITVFSR